jgi:hypothetical protein
MSKRKTIKTGKLMRLDWPKHKITVSGDDIAWALFCHDVPALVAAHVIAHLMNGKRAPK